MLNRFIPFVFFKKKVNGFLRNTIPQEVLQEVFLCLYKNKSSYSFKVEKHSIKSKEINKILFLSSAKSEKDGSFLYRCKFLMNALSKENYSVKYGFTKKNIIKNLNEIYNCDLIVFSRALEQPETMPYIHIAHLLNKIVIGDYDDPYFEHIAPFFGSVLSKRSHLKKERDKTLSAEKIYPFYHAVTCSTENIKKEFERKSIDAFIIPNRLNKLHIKKHFFCFYKNKKNMRLIYSSGTHTHSYDFSQYIAPIQLFLKKYPDVTLTVLGKSNKQFWVGFSKQVTFLKKTSFSKMISILKAHDLALAFLDKNIYNDCKSNIKFIESVASQTPFLSTNSEEYKKSIIDGKTGFLISQPSDLLDKLEFLYKNKHKLQEVKDNIKTIDESNIYITKKHIDTINNFFNTLIDK